ncbi:MAG: WD40 repeat domain-containing protein, partial [Planctomycetes bacterium]|nr:WD40 repeat domain-containing protein [Planctomycetota bacterium]
QRGVAAAAAKREAQARKRAERESEAKDLLLAQALAEKGGRLLSQKRHGRASSLFAASLLLRESSQARTGLMRSLERTRRERWSAGRSPLTSIAHLENGTLVVADLRGRIRVLEPGGESLALYGGTQGPVLSLDAAAGVVAAGLNSGQLAIWGSEDPNRPTLVPAHEGGVIALACNPGGSQIATVGLDATLKRWKADGTLLASYPLGFRPLCVAWSSDAAWLAAGGVDGLVAVRVADGALARAPKADRWITGLGFGPGGLFTADLQGSLIQWSIESPRESPSLRAGPAEPTGFPVTALAASDTGLVAVGSPLGKLRCYDSAQRAWTYETQLETHAITALHFDGQGRIAGTNERGVIGVFFPAKGKLNTTTTIARFTCLATLPLKSSTAFFAGDNRGRLTLGQSEALRAPATGPILPRRINGVAVSDNGALLAVCSNGRRLVVRNLSSQRQIELKGLSDGSAWSLDFYAERGLAASVGDKIRLWELPDPTPIIEVSAPGFVKAIACEPKTGRIAAAAVGGVVIWNTKGEELARLPLSVSAQDIAFDPGSQRVAIAAGTEILLWDPSRPGSEPRVLRGHEGVVLALAFNADGRRLVSGGNDSWVCLWDVRAGSLDTVLEGHQARVTDVEFDGLGQYAISVSEDGSIRTWDVAPPLAPREPPLGGWTLAFLRDGRLVSSGNTDGVVKSFDPATGATKGLFRSAARIHYLAEGPSQVLAFAAHRSRNVILFDLASSAQRHTLTHPGQVSALCFTPQPDQRLVTGSGLAIRIWDPATGKELKSWNLDREADHVSALGASPNGKWLAVGARASVHFFTPHGLGGPRIQLSEGHAPFGLDFSPNSRLLSVASQGLRQRARAVPLTGGAQRLEATGPGGLAEGEVHLLDVERQRSHSLRRHPRGSFATRFTPDGRFVAEGGGGIVLWEVATRRRWAEVVPGDDDLSRTSIAISPSGDLLATRTRKGHSKVWDLRKLGTYDSPAQAVHRAWRLSGYRVIGMNAIRSQTQTGFLIRSRMEELLRR